MRQDLRRPHPRDQEIDVSTPGAGGPQPPEQDPNQPGQPASWGHQPPADQSAGWGQQPPAGQPYPGQQPQQPWGAPQPGQPPAFGQPQGFGQPQAFGQPQGFGQPEQPAKPKRKWLPIVGGVVGLIVVLSALGSFLGAGDPEIGDCVKPDGSSFEKVDCDDDAAQAKIVGTDDDMTGVEFDATDVNELCTEVPSATVVLWSGTSNEDNGKVFCAEPI
jgi:hypothetical protein